MISIFCFQVEEIWVMVVSVHLYHGYCVTTGRMGVGYNSYSPREGSGVRLEMLYKSKESYQWKLQVVSHSICFVYAFYMDLCLEVCMQFTLSEV